MRVYGSHIWLEILLNYYIIDKCTVYNSLLLKYTYNDHVGFHFKINAEVLKKML